MRRKRMVSFIWKPIDLIIPGLLTVLLGVLAIFVGKRYGDMFIDPASVFILGGLIISSALFMIASGIYALTGEDVDRKEW